MTPAQITKWKKTRDRGRARYVLVTGVLYWGGMMTVTMSAFQYWMNPETFGVVRNLGLNLLLYPIGGLGFGIGTWAIAERSYSRHLETTIEDPEQAAS